MRLLPILQELESNPDFIDNPDCKESLQMTIDYYKKIGFNPPWIGYYAKLNNELVGSAGFKGNPKDGKIEIAYGTFPKYEGQGIGAEICRQLVNLVLKTGQEIKITARTLPEENASTSILKKNRFELLGKVWDEEDGNVWEWEFKNTTPNKMIK